MGITEDIRQKQQEIKEKENPSAEPKNRPSLKKIIADPEKFRLFGAYLDVEGAHDLGAGLQDLESMDQATIDALDEKRGGFLEIIERSDELKKSLDLKSLQQIINATPELKKIANLNGVEGIRDIFTKHLPEIAIRDRQAFENISEKIQNLAETRKRIDEGDKETEVLLKKYGISKKDYQQFLVDGDSEGLRKAMLGSLKTFKKFRIKIFNRKSRQEFDDELDSLDDLSGINHKIGELERDLSELGGSLHGAATDNETLKRMLISDLRSEGIVEPKEPDMTMAEFRKEPPDFDAEGETALKAEWTKWEADNQSYYTTGGGAYDVNFAQADFAREYFSKKMMGKKKGFWASLFQRKHQAGYLSKIKNIIK